MGKRILITGFLGMNRALPSTALDAPPVTDPRGNRAGPLVPRELINVCPWKLPRIRPRPAARYINEKASADTDWPRQR